MTREPIPTYCFTLAVVRLGHRFLVVQEREPGGGWYLPAGGVEPGESLVDGVKREVLEESGLPICVEGVVRIEHTPTPGGTARLRVIFVARPIDDTPPRTAPNDETLGARWVSLAELSGLTLRHEEVRELFEYVASGGPVYPLAVLGVE
jgi:phosphatase NudJ